MNLFSSIAAAELRTVPPRELRAGVSPDGLEISVLFDSLIADCTRKGPQVDIVAALCQLPVSLPPDRGLAGYLVHVRDAASMAQGVRGWLTVQFGGALATRAWPTGGARAIGEPDVEDIFLSFFAEDLVLSKESNPQRPEPLPPILAIVVGVELGELAAAARISIDAVDISALSS